MENMEIKKIRIEIVNYSKFLNIDGISEVNIASFVHQMAIVKFVGEDHGVSSI